MPAARAFPLMLVVLTSNTERRSERRTPAAMPRYGLEKLYAEEMAKVYGKDFPMETRIARSAPMQGLG